MICNFVPRKLDYHPHAVPIPYNHSNVDSDEIMFYAGGDYEPRARARASTSARSRCTRPASPTARSRAPSRRHRAVGATSTNSPSWSTPSVRWTWAPAWPVDGGQGYAWTWADGDADRRRIRTRLFHPASSTMPRCPVRDAPLEAVAGPWLGDEPRSPMAGDALCGLVARAACPPTGLQLARGPSARGRRWRQRPVAPPAVPAAWPAAWPPRADRDFRWLASS